MSDKPTMLARLEAYQLSTPQSDTKTMPASLRKEVREYIEQYVGSYSSRVAVIKSLKKDEYIRLHKKGAEQRFIKKYSGFIDKLNDLSEQMRETLKLCDGVWSHPDSYDVHDVFDNGEQFTLILESVTNEIEKEFKEKYDKDFEGFRVLLESYEKKLEEVILFGTITDVYKLIKDYDQIDPYIKRLSDLKVE